MNYLGHLYFSGNDTELMQANLFGDFVKGSKLDHFPPVILKGILLHRKIDDYIDHFPAVKDLQDILRPQLPKVSGIAIDLYFDHLLALNWEQFHPQKLQEYLTIVYTKFTTKNNEYSADFNRFTEALVRYNWISHYPTQDAIEKMSRSLSSKLSFPNSLADGLKVYRQYEKEISAAFFEYMEAAREHFLTDNHRILS